jgi:hypothetical protein
MKRDGGYVAGHYAITSRPRPQEAQTQMFAIWNRGASTGTREFASRLRPPDYDQVAQPLPWNCQSLPHCGCPVPFALFAKGRIYECRQHKKLSAGSCQKNQSRVTSQELPLSILIRLDCSHCCDYAFSGHASLLQDHRSLARWLRQRCRQKMQWFDLLVP